jgi:hypothetical protein
MLVADRNALKANLAKGTLQNQLSLVMLYKNNFNALATVGILISAFSYTGVNEVPYPHASLKDIYISYPFYFFNTISLMCWLFVSSQSTIATMYGPAMALRGSTAKAVAKAVSSMLAIQENVLAVGGVGIIATIISTNLLAFARVPYPIAIMMTFISTIISIIMISTVSNTYYLFRSKEIRNIVSVNANTNTNDNNSKYYDIYYYHALSNTIVTINYI